MSATKISTVSTTSLCPECGETLPQGCLQGLCPRCVARQAAGILGVRTGAVTPTLNAQASTHLRYFGDYELLEEIAHGGMGVVWKARQISLNRIVAVKLLLAGKFSSPEFVQRFRAEAEAAANLQHPNIVAIHEVGEHEGHQYFSMDYVEGQNLAQLVLDQPLSAQRSATLLKAVVEAVHYAHQKGILHRDLKPANILLDLNDQPRVTDFGLAKRLDDSQFSNTSNQLTLTGQVLGTPAYTSPEQAGGKRGEVGPLTDVYSLGAVLYFLLTSRAPFVSNTLEETLRQVHETEPISPRLLNPAVPRDLETICRKCLNKDPRRRYESAQALADDLGRFLKNEPIHSRPVSKAEKVLRWCRRKPALAALIVAVHLVGAFGLAGILWQWRRAEANANSAQQHAARETTERHRAEEAVTMLELQRAEDLFEKDEITMGMAYLARMVRQQPTNQIATRRLLSALTQRNFALPVGLPLRHDKRVWYAEFSPNGRRIVTASADFTARVWDSRSGESLTPPLVHSSDVRFAEFSPDGERLVTFADNGSAYLWEASTGRALGQPMAHTQKISSAHFSPDGRHVVTASRDGTARIWNAQTGEAALPPLRHQGQVNWARFSPDGQRVVTASDDQTAQLWDAQTGQALGKPLVHAQAVEFAEFRPDGKRIVTAARDFSTCVWDVASGQPVGKPLLHSAKIRTISFSPDGERVLVALHSGMNRVWNARDWAPLTQPMQHQGQSTAVFSPEAQRVLTASIDSTARLWDGATGHPLMPPLQHDGLVWSARLSADGQYAVTASADKTARVWDVRLGGIRSEPMPHNGPVVTAEFSPDGKRILTGSWDSTACVWNPRPGQWHSAELRQSGPVQVAQFSPDGGRVATGSDDGTARIWDSDTCEPLTEPLAQGANVSRLQFSPDGQTLATASWVNGLVRLWNVRTGQPQGEPIRHRSGVHVLAFSPDGRRLLTDDFERDVAQIRDVESHQLLLELQGHEGFLQYGEFSPNGQRVVTASEDGTARIWHAETGQPLTEPLRHKGLVRYARFSRDGRRIVTASEDTTARVWDAQTGQPLAEPLRHRSEVNSADFSPDGLLVTTASSDDTMRLWDAVTGRPVAEPFEHYGKVVSTRFSPDGRRVLTASSSGIAHLWDVPPAAPLEIRNGQLLAGLAEAVIGKEISAQAMLESVSSGGLAAIRRGVAELPQDADFTRWLEWFFADRGTRTISPYSQTCLPDYIYARTLETNCVFWREALILCPTNGEAFGRMAQYHLEQGTNSISFDLAQADWFSRQGVKFAPWDGGAWHYRNKVKERTGGWTELLEEAERALQLQPTNAYAWHAKARALEAAKQFDPMLAACNRAMESWNADERFHTDLPMRREILARRALALRHLGRLREAGADNAAALSLPARDPAASKNLIDLGIFYNGGWFEGCPGKVVRLAGCDFDFRGWVQLDYRLVMPEVTDFPERVNDIPIEQLCHRLHFLHTLVWSNYRSRKADDTWEEAFHVRLGSVVGRYVIHYADGQQAEVPINHGRDVRDWWHYPESAPDDPALIVAWEGSDPVSRQHGATTRVYKSTWQNPRPDVAIRSLDFVHAKTSGVPVLIAITAEP